MTATAEPGTEDTREHQLSVVFTPPYSLAPEYMWLDWNTLVEVALASAYVSFIGYPFIISTEKKKLDVVVRYIFKKKLKNNKIVTKSIPYVLIIKENEIFKYLIAKATNLFYDILIKRI